MAARRSTLRLLACGLFPALCLGGCTLSGGGLEDMIDRSITTGSITAPAAGGSLAAATAEGLAPTGKASPVGALTQLRADPERLSDGRTVRNAVSSAKLAPAPLAVAWANADTGASGTITTIEELREGAAICRRFTTSRQRFDGIALYNGEACTAGAGEWVLTKFGEAG